MRLIEEISMNAVPSLQTVLYDGWILRFADRYGNRANSVNPIYPSEENVNKKIDNCERIFSSKNMKPTFKITPFVFPNNLDDLLKNRGYDVIHLTSVQTLNLDNISEPNINLIEVDYEFNEKWYMYFCNYNNINNNHKNTYRKMLNSIIPTKFYITLIKEDEVIACGMAVLDNDYIGIFDIVVKENQRNKGYGMQLLLNILKIGKSNGAKNAYLQVMLNNKPALQLYSKIGFKEVYQYHYRVLA